MFHPHLEIDEGIEKRVFESNMSSDDSKKKIDDKNLLHRLRTHKNITISDGEHHYYGGKGSHTEFLPLNNHAKYRIFDDSKVDIGGMNECDESLERNDYMLSIESKSLAEQLQQMPNGGALLKDMDTVCLSQAPNT